MDQCGRCTVYGDYEQCRITPCGKHEDWIVEYLTAALTSAKEEIERLREQERATEKERRYWYDLAGKANAALASERKETERWKALALEAPAYFAPQYDFEGKKRQWTDKLAALQSRQGEE